MGRIQNVHTVVTAELKAEAERIAVLRGRALTQILEAANSFDEAGQYYWEYNLRNAEESVTRGFGLLRDGRSKLLDASTADIRFEDQHKESPKLQKALELGLNQYEYRPDRFLATRLTYDRRLIDLISHLVSCEEAATAGIRDGDIKALDNAISAPGRQLLETTADYLGRLIRDSRITHEVAYTVEMVWVAEGQPELA